MSSNVRLMASGGAEMLSDVTKMSIMLEIECRKCDQMLAQNVMECEA